jgi:hypothetical protein
MREEQNYNAAPILADALQDADLADEDILTKLRASNTKLIELWRLVALIYSDESAAAVKWMLEFAEKMRVAGEKRGDDSYPSGIMSFDYLMAAAKKYIDDGDWISGPGYSWEDLFEENMGEFWANYELVSGTDVKDHEGDFVSCSC